MLSLSYKGYHIRWEACKKSMCYLRFIYSDIVFIFWRLISVDFYLLLVGPRDVSGSAVPSVADEGSIVTLTCLTSSSNPPANITWYSEGTRLLPYTTQVSPSAFSGSSSRYSIEIPMRGNFFCAEWNYWQRLWGIHSYWTTPCIIKIFYLSDGNTSKNKLLWHQPLLKSYML